MNRHFKALVGMLAALVVVVGLAACTATESTFALDINDESGALMIAADNAEGELTSSIEIGENDVLQLSPFFDKGGVVVKLADDAGNVVFEQAAEGKDLAVYEVDPGTYEVTVTAQGNPTGTMTIYAADVDELAEMDAALEETLEEIESELEEAKG